MLYNSFSLVAKWQKLLLWSIFILLISAVSACGSPQPELLEEVPPRRGNADVLGEVQDITAEVLGIPFADVAEEADFRQDLGANEEQMAEIAEIFEEAFSVTLTEEEVTALTTVGSAVDLIVSKQ